MNPGALVISLDFELHWGVLQRPLHGPYRANLLGVPESVRGTLALFREFEIAATWATVGFLFARSREERLRHAPAVRPRYADPALDPYVQPTGESEGDDPFHYAPSLIREIQSTPRQEIGTHTFSHFYCLEPGVTAEAFRADLESARAIAREVCGAELRSLVLPRNQHNPAFDDVLLDSGIVCYRGNQRSWMWRPRGSTTLSPLVRALRIADAYLPLGGSNSFRFDEVPQPNGTFNVPASFFVRPGSRGIKARRIHRALRDAARRGEVLHLWWHPHNFGVRTAENLRVLRSLLETFAECRARYGMESLSMAGVVDRCRQAGVTPRSEASAA